MNSPPSPRHFLRRTACIAAAVALFLALPAAAANPTLQAAGVLGDSLQARSRDATVLLEAGVADAPTLSLTAQSWQMRTVSETDDYTVGSPSQPQTGLVHHKYDTTAYLDNGSVFQLGMARHAGAKVIIRPSSDDYEVAATSRGPYLLGVTDGLLLDKNHYQSESPTNSSGYYEYTVGPSLQLNLSGTDASVTGDFQVYVWGFETVRQGASPAAFVTGYTGGPVGSAEPTLNPLWPVWKEYYNYTVLTVLGGRLSFGAATPVPLYGQSFDAHAAGQTTFVGAQGDLPTVGGDYRFSGDATVQGAAYEWVQQGGKVGVAATRVDSAQGSVSFVPTPLQDRWWFPYSVGAGVLGAVAVTALALPSVSGYRSRAGEGAGWRGVRARGYARWALAADASSRYGRAAFWMGMAARASPREAQFLTERGIFLRLAGKPLPALKAHRDAHDVLSLMPDASMAHNAYEAAKAAVAADLRVEAIDWLRLAVETEPSLAEEAQIEPAFAPLRADPDYQSLTGPARLGGLLGT